jgi:hypothetical protein
MHGKIEGLIGLFGLALTLWVPSLVTAGDVQTELNGFKLWQFKNAIESSLGRPNQTSGNDRMVAEAHVLDQNCYMVFEYDKQFPHNVAAIQLTGHSEKAIPFKGLRVGAPVSEVERVLGKPTRVDKGISPPVSIYRYRDANYTVEIDEKGQLFSIKILAAKEVFSTIDSSTCWVEFQEALKTKNISALLATLRPDVEIYKDGEVITISKGYAEFARTPDKKFVDAFFGDKDSVRSESSIPELELRLAKGLGVGSVYKFYNGTILTEIVLFPYDGKDRVYEIAFKDKRAPKETQNAK